MRYLAIIGVLILLFGCVLPGSNSGNPNATKPISQQQPSQVEQQPTQPPQTQPAQNQPSQTQPSQTQQPSQNTSAVPPAPVLSSKEISYDESGWTIYGTLYPSKDRAPSKLIVLVPGLGTTRDAYPLDFISSLHDAVPDAIILAIDPKGHGKSTNLGSWRDFDYSLFLDMRNDITAAKPYIIAKYPTVKQIYVVGASMGSTSALLAGVKEKSITKVAMISPGIAFNNVDITAPGALDSYSQQLLLVASTGDSYSLNSAYQINSMTSEPQTTMKIYPGSAHGTALFDDTKGDDTPLSSLLIDFLSK